MSGFSAIFQLNGNPPAPEQAERAARALVWRGPDGVDRWTQGPVALAHAHRWVTPEEVGERQPVASASGRCRITGDIRLDNRDELLPQLRAELPSSDPPSDAQLVLAAYERWGEEAPRHLVGDYAFAIWDAGCHRLFCARDPLGLRPLHYSLEGRTLCLASDVRSVLHARNHPPATHRPFLEDWLADTWDRAHHETAYEGVLRLPAGYSLTVDYTGTRLSRFRTLGTQPPAPLRDEREYFDAFRELFERSVRARLRSSQRIAVSVSGGLDSSSLACVVDRLVGSGVSTAGVPLLLSSVFENTPSADEREFLEPVIAACPRLEPHLVPSDGCWAYRDFGSDRDWPLAEPDIHSNRALEGDRMRAAGTLGARVMLGGWGADEVLVGQPYHMPYLFGDVRPSEWARELPHFRRYARVSAPELLASAFVLPLLPQSLRRTLRGLRDRRADRTGSHARRPSAVPPLLDQPLRAPHLRTRSARQAYWYCHSGLRAVGLVSEDLLTHQHGIELRNPFLDERLVEFLLAVPQPVRFSGGQFKRVMLEAMAGVLPETVRQRRSFSHFGDLLDRGHRERERERIQALLSDSLVVSERLVERGALERLRQELAEGAPGRFLRGMHLLLSMEAWLRHGAGGSEIGAGAHA